MQKQCSICGSCKRLTYHHIVPKRYMNIVPMLIGIDKYRKCLLENLVTLCHSCHNEIESLAKEYSKKILIKFNCQEESLKEHYRIYSLSKQILKSKSKKQIDTSKDILKKVIVNEEVEKNKIQDFMMKEILNWENPSSVLNYLIVISVLKNNKWKSFVQGWRQHWYWAKRQISP